MTILHRTELNTIVSFSAKEVDLLLRYIWFGGSEETTEFIDKLNESLKYPTRVYEG